jgi:hypothetical protein
LTNEELKGKRKPVSVMRKKRGRNLVGVWERYVVCGCPSGLMIPREGMRRYM